MLYIVNGEKYTKVSAQDLVQEFRLDPYVIKSLQKKASFRQRPDRLRPDRNNPALKKANNSTRYDAKFPFKNKDGVQVYLHLCESDFPNDKGVPQLEPKKTSFAGATFAINDNFEKAVFFFLHPFNAQSPLFPGSKKYLYTFVNAKQESQKKLNEIDNLELAFSKFRELSDIEIKFMVRGLGLIRNVEDLDDEELSFALKSYAKDNPVDFLSKLDVNKTVHFKGRILNLLDKGYFQVNVINNTRQWVITEGKMKGQYIGEPMLNQFQDADDHLINSINTNIGAYSELLKEAYDASVNSDDFEDNIVTSGILEMLGSSAKPADKKDEQKLVLPDPNSKNFRKDVVSLLKSYGVSGHIDKQNTIITLITSGQLDETNINAVMNNLK